MWKSYWQPWSVPCISGSVSDGEHVGGRDEGDSNDCDGCDDDEN